MTTYVRSADAARRLGVTLNTLYAYVSRGRVSRTIGADGRTSLFDLDELDALRAQSHRRPTEPPPSIDVRIGTAITHLDENGPSYRGHRIETLLDLPFERVAELLWAGDLPASPPTWPSPACDSTDLGNPTIAGLINAALELDVASHGSLDGAEFTRQLLADIAGPSRPDTDEPIALRLTRRWTPNPPTALVAAVDRALVLLADHELATSTLAVRVATSTSATTAMSLVAGLATVTGDLHGGAPRHAQRLLERAGQIGATAAIGAAMEEHGRAPGFGHSIYRMRDPRFLPLLDLVRALPDPNGRLRVVDEVLLEAGSTVPSAPNIDLAMGALTWVGGLPDDAPLFAIARLAGWTAHHLEERGERPLRFRGLAR